MTKTIDLRQPKYDLRKARVGTVVITSKGFKFKLMSRKTKKECWLDCTSKAIWHDREDKTYTHYEAVRKFGDALPTIEEFKEAETHGFREVLPNMEHWFWSSSLNPNGTGFAQDFYGNGGSSNYYSRDYYKSVRCVGR